MKKKKKKIQVLYRYQSCQPEPQAALGQVNSLRWPWLPMAGLSRLQALSLSQHYNTGK